MYKVVYFFPDTVYNGSASWTITPVIIIIIIIINTCISSWHNNVNYR